MNILIVDDSPSLVQLIKQSLNPPRKLTETLDALFGEADTPEDVEPEIKTFEANQGQAGLEVVIEQSLKGDPIDLIITDISMPPGYDGWELIKRVRDENLIKQPKIIVVSAYSDFSVSKQKTESQKEIIAYLRKPFEQSELKEIVESVKEALLKEEGCK